MDFHIGVIQTIWWLNLTSFPGCSGARAKPEFKLYWGEWWSSSQHLKEPWWRQTVPRLVSKDTSTQVGALWPGEPPKNVPSPPDEMHTCKGPQEHQLHSHCKKKSQVQNVCATFPAPESWLFVTPKPVWIILLVSSEHQESCCFVPARTRSIWTLVLIIIGGGKTTKT